MPPLRPMTDEGRQRREEGHGLIIAKGVGVFGVESFDQLGGVLYIFGVDPRIFRGWESLPTDEVLVPLAELTSIEDGIEGAG